MSQPTVQWKHLGKKQKLETFMTYINNVDHFMRFSHEDVKDNRLAFLANQYCTHTKSYFLNEHRALQHELLCKQDCGTVPIKGPGEEEEGRGEGCALL